MSDLSVIIPARSEMFLSRTIDDLLANIRGDTEIIAVLDGNWPNPPVKDNPKVTLIYHSQPIGQRAACNEAIRYSRAKYIAKCDAHCGFDEGFDVKLMTDIQDDWTMVPIMRNLWIFDWLCPNGHRRYQGPSGPCTECGKPTQRDIKWIGKNNPQSTAYCFDPEPHFQYANDFKKRPWYQKAIKETGLTETMSLQGSFFMMTREKYFELGMNDEAFGSWGSQGLEIAIRTWTSGGKVICSHKTWYSHCFRSQGGDFGFPWPCSGRQVDRTKKRAKAVFFKQKWGPQQIYPLSWLVSKFWPVPHWAEDDLRNLKESEAAFSHVFSQPSSRTDFATSTRSSPLRQEVSVSTISSSISGFRDVRVGDLPVISSDNSLLSMSNGVNHPISNIADGATPGLSGNFEREDVSIGAMCLTGIDRSNGAAGSEHMVGMEDEVKMERVTTGGIVTDGMVKDGDILSSTLRKGIDQPCVHQPMGMADIPHEPDVSISKIVSGSIPHPAPGNIINGDFVKEMVNKISGQNEGACEIFTGSHKSSSCEDLRLETGGCLNHSPVSPIISNLSAPVNPSLPSRGIIYYSDCQLNPEILEPCQKQLLRCSNGHKIVSVTLKPMDFGENYTLPLERSILTMFKQILEGIKRSTADILFFTEHDCLYTKEHFQFTPPRKDVFYYNENQWQVDATTGRALFYHCMRLSAMCAYRELLLEHYTKRVERFEKEPFTLRCGYEPGGHRYPRGIDNYTRERFMTPYPLIDLRHPGTVSPNRWRQKDFRNQGPLWAWTESGVVPFWGQTKGRMKEFLESLK